MNKYISAEHFNAFIDEIPQPVCLLKICNKEIFAWNELFRNITGFHESEIKGKTWSLLFSFDENSDWNKLLSELKQKGLITYRNGNLINNHRKKIPVLFSLKLIKIDGDDFFLFSFSDITEVIASENQSRHKLIKDQRLRFHFENTPLAIVEWDTDFVVTRWSKKAEKIFGWKGKDVIGTPIMDLNLIYHEDILIVERTMERLLKEKTVVSSNRNVTKDGRIIHCVWYNSVLKDEKGKMLSVMSLVDDVTARKEAEDQLLNYSEKLEKIVDSRTAELTETNIILQEEITTRAIAEKTLREQTRELEKLKNNLEELVYERTSDLQANNKKLTREIVERRRAVEALRESERKYREIVQNIPGMVFQLKIQRDGTNKFTYVSPRAGDLFDLAFEEVSEEWEFTNHIHPDDRPAFLSSIGRAINTQQEWNFEGRILTSDNHVKWFHGISSPSLVGQELVMDGLMLDITEQKLMEEALLDSEKHFRTLFSSIEDGFAMLTLICDENGNAVDWLCQTANPAFKKHTGISADKVIGKKASDIFKSIDQLWMEAFSRVVRTGVPEHFELHSIGLARTFSVYAYKTSGNSFAIIFHDLTEKKEFFEKIIEAQKTAKDSQMHYSKLFDSMHDGVQVNQIIFDETGKTPVDWVFLAANPAWYKQTGITVDVVGMRVKELIPDLEQVWLETYGRVVKTGVPESFESYNAFTKRFFFTYTYKLKDHQCAVVVEDVTKKREMQKQLEYSEKRYRSVFEMITDGFEIMEILYNEKNEVEDLRYLSVNPSWYRHTGLKIDVAGKLVSEVIPGIEKVWMEKYSEVVKSGIPTRYSEYNAFTDKWFEVRTFLIEGNICGTLLRDITQEKKEETEIKVNLTKYHVLFDSFPMGITVTDKNGNIVEINEMAHDILDLEKTEAAKRTISDRKWNIIRPDGSILPPKEFASVQALATNQIVANQEMGLVSDSGEVKWINVTAAPIPLDSYGVAITYNDISEKVKTRELLEENDASYRALFNTISEGYSLNEIVLDDEERAIDFIYLDVNPAFEKITGLKRKDVVGKKATQIFPNLEKDWLDIFRDVANTGKTVKMEKFSNVLRKYFEVFVFSPAHGQFATVFRDISDQKMNTRIKKK